MRRWTLWSGDLDQDHWAWEEESSIRMMSLLGRVTLLFGGGSPMTGGRSIYSNSVCCWQHDYDLDEVV